MRLFRSMKPAAAPFCALLTLAFAAASAGSIVDGVVHEMDTPHSHHHLSFAETVFDSHHDGEHAHAGHDGGKAQDGDHFGAGHHHHHFGDGPTGFMSAGVPAVTRDASASDVFGRIDDRPAPRFGGGAERPPRPVSHA